MSAALALLTRPPGGLDRTSRQGADHQRAPRSAELPPSAPARRARHRTGVTLLLHKL